MYEYRATITRIVDGDTVDADVDLGFGVTIHQRFRLYGINAPETRGESRAAGKAATFYLQKLLGGEVPTDLIVRTLKDKQGKFGRYLAILLRDGKDLNAQMVADGHAEEYMRDE